MSTNNRSVTRDSTLAQSSVKLQALQKTLKERIRWLFTKEGYPVLIAIIVGFLVGVFVNGALGVVLATIAGLFVLKVFGKLHIPTKPWQELLVSVLPIVAKLSFLMVFFLPIADYLTLPSGHTPDTLMKYVSILFVVPKNLISGTPIDVFPGIPIIVLVSVILMFWGSLNLEKKKNFSLAFWGLLLYTLSPTIASATTGDARLRFLIEFFAVGYYLAWVGLALIPITKYILPRLLKTQSPTNNPAQVMNRFMSIVPVFMVAFFLSDLSTLNFQLSINTFQDYTTFEILHHLVAGIFGGGIAGIGAGAIVSQIPEPEEAEEPEIPEEAQGPQLSTDPDDIPGTTIEYNPDGTITKRLPDGTVGTKYGDGTVYVELPDGSKLTYYPDGTKKMWTPDGQTQTDYPDGNSFLEASDGRTATISPDGITVTKLLDGGSVTVYPDGRTTKTNADGSSETWDKDYNVIEKTLGSDAGENAGFSCTRNPNGSYVMSSPYGGSVNVDAHGNTTDGSITLKDGTNLTFNPDSSKQVIMSNGDIMTFSSDGSVDSTFNDGTKITMDSDGSTSCVSPDGSHITVDSEGNIDGSGHFVLPDGRTVDINPDNTMQVKSPNGDSATVNPDGSVMFNGFDGAKIEVNKDGSGTGSTPDGTTWGQKSDGSGFVNAGDGRQWTMNSDGSGDFNAPDGSSAHVNSNGTGSMTAPDGSTASLNKDGSATINDAGGKSTTVTKDQLQANSQALAHQSDNVVKSD